MMSKIDEELVERAYNGKTSSEDALLLLDAEPFELFRFADNLRYEAVGDLTTYVVNRNINFTNRCIGRCGFCAFKKDEGYILKTEEILAKVEEAHKAGATEVCIQGGLLPNAGLDLYTGILEAVKEEYPSIHVHAFSPMEVYHASRTSDLSVKQVLHELKKSGLGTMPGTAAEILCDHVRKELCPGKLLTAEWVDVVTSAHKTGIRTTATMMYGHIESWQDRIEHMMVVRDVQKETGGITEFVPLPFMPYNNPVGKKMIQEGRYATTGIDDLKVYALSRIIFHKHINNIQASWVKLGKKLAQVALYCGANDLGGTLMEESISTSAGANNGSSISTQELEWIIKGASRIPKQRTTLYEIDNIKNESFGNGPREAGNATIYS
ncbi:5-amino-6-(D-ribitylamino)uracil--L-tyrosine 4-hydroxyphenyl transferase CofH [uncultured Methanomethylovorans sp.]|uniref:5-amino-6-(D-ribitylamino)uracil--L-tyrosine 4-hydroxyphenyl transferase CofH n=1 Tax=uncultured Methanomethylovorans sp. TaxID=183759 RepID=UPI002AA914AA|nr:5-amino-6-(D-ribitylamino)uracil--L-tyrosine 4-hydroxyphenyl transferase CofH [uncultured Methanomethylovorans sp.]